MTPSDLVALVARLRETATAFVSEYSLKGCPEPIEHFCEWEAATALEHLQAQLTAAEEDVSELRALDNEAQHGADELAADAGRYRWLRKGGDYTLHVINPDAGHVEGETLDAIIDTARAQVGEK